MFLPALGAAAAALFSSSKDIVSKSLAFSVSGASSAFGSFLFPLPIYAILLALLWLMGVPVFEVSAGFWFYVIIRALTDAAGETAKMYALGGGDLSVVSIVLSLMPIITVFLSPFITGDAIDTGDIVGAIIVVLATLIVTLRSPSSSKGVWWALLAVICMSLNHCFDRVAVQSGNPVYSAATMTFFAMLGTAPLFKLKGSINELKQNTKSFWLRGIFEVLFMIAKLYALTYYSAPIVMLALRSSLFINVIAGLLIFKEKQAGLKILGSILTLIGVGIAVFW